MPVLLIATPALATEYRWTVTAAADGRSIVYARRLVFGSGGRTYRYPEFKSYFDSVQQQENYTIALERM